MWIHLRKEHFPARRFRELAPRVDDLFKVLECMNNNAYKIMLPKEYNVHATVNLIDLSPCYNGGG